MELLFVVLIVLSFFACRQFTQGPSSYRNRGGTRKKWRRAFPNKRKESIRLFLGCFGRIALSLNTKLKFGPDDKVIEIYRSLYGGKIPKADSMECEVFIENLAHAFSLSEEKILEAWHEDITLRELYEFVSA